MAILSISDPKISALLKREPLRGKRIIGKGMYCRVFEAADPKRVYKLTADPGHVAYLTDGCAPRGMFKPIVYENHGIVAQTGIGLDVWLLEVERLHRLQRNSRNYKLAKSLIRFSEYRRENRAEAFPSRFNVRLPCVGDEFELDMPYVEPGLLRFTEALNRFALDFQCCYDLHTANFMQRADGTLVLSDPVYDECTRRHAFNKRAY